MKNKAQGAAGFDNAAYIEKQSAQILKRVERFNRKLYLEFGGKLFDDFHASRVLPGFKADGKVLLLKELSERIEVEIIVCVSAADIDGNKTRADLGITYDLEVLRLIDSIRIMGLNLNSVVVTQYKDQPSADTFINKLKRRGEKAYIHRLTKGYPSDVNLVVSDEGYGANPFIETVKPLVVVTAPGPGSGKMATCLSQLYHEHKRGVKAGYAKFETFPVWNLPLNHPVNLAYEAATADLNDVNTIDPFHLETYGEAAVNYNRDIEVFPIVKNILGRIMESGNVYHSPTDMGVNMAGFCIVDDRAVRAAAVQEIIRRYFITWCRYKEGTAGSGAVQKLEIIMKQLGVVPECRPAVSPALEKAKNCGCPAASLILSDGRVVTGRTKGVMSAASGLVLNGVKALTGIPDEVHLISPAVLEPMLNMKENILHDKNPLLNLGEVLNALSICAATDSAAEECCAALRGLNGCEAHSSHILSQADETALRKLGVNVTCTPEFSSANLFYI